MSLSLAAKIIRDSSVHPAKRPALYISCVTIALCIGWISHLASEASKPYEGSRVAYTAVQSEVENAVTAYLHSNNGSLPTLSGTYTNADCSNCSVINMSALIMANGGIMKTYPTGLASVDVGNDNCGGNTSLGCKNGSSYVWLVNTKGDVYSFCAGTGCTTNNSGYQGVWP